MFSHLVASTNAHLCLILGHFRRVAATMLHVQPPLLAHCPHMNAFHFRMIRPHVHAPCCYMLTRTLARNYAIVSQIAHAIKALSCALLRLMLRRLCATFVNCYAQCLRSLVPHARLCLACTPHCTSCSYAHALVRCCVHHPHTPLRALSRLP